MANGFKKGNLNNGDDKEKMDNLHFISNEVDSKFSESCANQIVEYFFLSNLSILLVCRWSSSGE